MNSFRKLRILLCACLALLSLIGFGVPDSQASEKDRVLTVMTRNMDNGTDFGPIFTAPPQQFLATVATTYAEIQASNIPERAEAVAKEIEATRPDLVGLQEAFTYRTGPIGGPATTVTYDALQSLLDALARRGLHYAPVAILTNLDAEVPAYDSSSGLFFDVRATDHDVVLARTDLPVSQLKLSTIQAQHFPTIATFSSQSLGTLEIPRGWIMVEGKKRGKQFRFVTTHLESLSPVIQAAQAGELLSGPAHTALPVILAGDFNSDAQSSDPAQNAAYRILIDAGFMDAWSAIHPGDQGFTWPLHGEDPVTPSATPNQRIDLVLIKGQSLPVTVDLLGNQLTDLTPSGLWPSDHAGLVASSIMEP